MALTPKINIKLTEYQKGIADNLEARIDRCIKMFFDGGDDSVVKVDILDFSRDYGDSFPKIRDEISRKYDEAGWNVNYKYKNENDKFPAFVELSQKK